MGNSKRTSEQQETIPQANSLAVEKSSPMAVTPSPGQMLQAMIEKGVTAENINAVEKLTELYWKMEEKSAEKEFTQAFVRLQAEMPNVKAMKPVPNNDGTVRYNYASYEDIWDQVAPYLKTHGFTVTFSTDFKESRLIKTCVLHHIGGHKIENSFAVRIGAGPPRSNETQADGAASTYAKRFALCDILGIVIEKDTDARVEGTPITPEQAEELERRVKLTNSDVPKFLKTAGANSFKEIMSSKYNMLDEMLRKKEQQGK